MFTFLLVVQAIIAAALVTVILMQRSEGGGLTGGSPSGLMSARGAADFLTRSTAILATVFVSLSIVLAVLAAQRQTTTVDAATAKAVRPVTQIPAGAVPQSPAPAIVPAPSNATTPAATGNSAVPLAQ